MATIKKTFWLALALRRNVWDIGFLLSGRVIIFCSRNSVEFGVGPVHHIEIETFIKFFLLFLFKY
jgi:hypothetical protein